MSLSFSLINSRSWLHWLGIPVSFDDLISVGCKSWLEGLHRSKSSFSIACCHESSTVFAFTIFSTNNWYRSEPITMIASCCCPGRSCSLPIDTSPIQYRVLIKDDAWCFFYIFMKLWVYGDIRWPHIVTCSCVGYDHCLPRWSGRSRFHLLYCCR